MSTIDIAEGRNTAFDMLVKLSGVTDQAQRAHILADALGDQIDVCFNPSNMAPTLGRLHGFAEVLAQHLNAKASPPQTAADDPYRAVNLPNWGVASYG